MKPANYGDNKEQLIEGLQIMNKLISNLLTNPADEKFRTIKTSNKAIQAKLFTIQPISKIHEMLEVLGYV